MVIGRERGARAVSARRGQVNGRDCGGCQGRERDAVERGVHGISSPCAFLVYRLPRDAGVAKPALMVILRYASCVISGGLLQVGAPPRVCGRWRPAIGAFLMSSLRHAGRADHEQLTQSPHTLTPHVCTTSLRGSGYDKAWPGWPVNSTILSAGRCDNR